MGNARYLHVHVSAFDDLTIYVIGEYGTVPHYI